MVAIEKLSGRLLMSPESVVACLKPHLNRVLRVAAVGMQGEQLKAFRSIVLDEFGRNGFEAELERLQSRTDLGKAGREG